MDFNYTNKDYSEEDTWYSEETPYENSHNEENNDIKSDDQNKNGNGVSKKIPNKTLYAIATGILVITTVVIF